MEKIFFSKKAGNYYSQDFIPCFSCGIVPDKIIFLITFMAKKKSTHHFYCGKCVHDVPENPHIVKTIKSVVISDIIPKDATPHFNDKVDIGYGKAGLTVFEVATRQIDNETITDRTVLAGRESFEGALVGCPDMDRLQEKERVLSLPELNKELRDIFEAEIAYENKDKIEFKEIKK